MTGDQDAPMTRTSAHIEGDFAVFLTGMRINNFWKVHEWYPNFHAMRKILPPLFSNPEFGALGAHAWWSLRGPLLIGYFRSVDQLLAFANDPTQPHAEAWRDFFRRVSSSKSVGLWHETYIVRAGEYETVYDFMPKPVGLAMCTENVPVMRKGDRAVQRLAREERAAREASPAVDPETV